MSKIQTSDEPRINLLDNELNRVLGGGLVPGSLTLLGGEPGIGKSTLILQTVLHLKGLKVLYVSGEESARQLKLRADRILEGKVLEAESDWTAANLSDTQVVCEAMIETVFKHIETVQPDLVVIDSIQTMATETVESSPGSVTQIRECAAQLLKYAKESNIPVLLIGHINKEGSIAGPKILEHMVDTVLQFEGDQHYMYRIVRAIKNRFGSTSELAVFEMTGTGLREVENPSEMLIPMHQEGLSGTAISAMLDGNRPFLFEVQALASSAVYGTAQRSATGFDVRRLNMLLAVLERRAGFKLGQKDVFLNMAGGLRITDPAADLAVICAVLSSNFDYPIKADVCFAGEVGLSGEIRPVSQAARRAVEAARLGFKKIFVSSYTHFDTKPEGIEIVKVADIPALVKALFK